MKDDLYRLMWEDTFAGEGGVNPDNWTHALGHGRRGWGNMEQQSYTDKPENCRIQDGHLVITAIRHPDGSCSSARIHTYGKASWQYGRFEIRARLPQGRGTWPAIWMLGDSIHEGVGWPLCGEIDIMEHIGRVPEIIHFSLHTEAYNHRKDTQITETHHLPGISYGFHTYRADWDEKGFAFYIDDRLMSTFYRNGKQSVEEWPFDQPFHLILNLAIGGHWGGEIDETAFPAVMEIEFVRVYQKIPGKRRE